MMLLGCSKQIEPIVIENKITPPFHLVESSEIPNFKGATNNDLLIYAKDLQSIIKLQNINMEAIKKWFKTL